MSISLYFIHQGKSRYLKYAVNQACRSNPGSDIYLLWDSMSNHSLPVKQYDIKNYKSSASEFSKIYLHLSQQGYENELICFKRWFILYEFAIKEKVNFPIMYLDSDIMLYRDLKELESFLKQYSITICDQKGPEYAYFESLEVLKGFCDFLMDTYSNENEIKKMRFWFENYKKGHSAGGVCDMTLFEKYVGRFGNKAFDLCNVYNNSVFDDNINASQGYEMKGDMKKIIWQNGIPYGKQISSNKLIRFNALHLQGHSKLFYIQRFYKEKGLLFYKLWDELIMQLRNIKKFIFK